MSRSRPIDMRSTSTEDVRTGGVVVQVSRSRPIDMRSTSTEDARSNLTGGVVVQVQEVIRIFFLHEQASARVDGEIRRGYHQRKGRYQSTEIGPRGR